MKFHNVILLATALAFGCEVKTNAVVTTAPSEEKTKEVVDHHWVAFKANDLEAIMADYSEESVIVAREKTYKGLVEISEGFKAVFTTFPKDSTTFQLDTTIIHQDIAYIIWQASAPKIKVSFGTDTFIIQNGKIVRQTFAGVMGQP